MTKEEAPSSIELFGTTLKESDAIEFIKSFDGGHVCPCCAKTEWEVNFIPPGSNEYLSIRTGTEIGGLGKNHLPIFAMVCESCGFLRLHATYALSRWVNERDKDKEKSE